MNITIEYITFYFRSSVFLICIIIDIIAAISRYISFNFLLNTMSDSEFAINMHIDLQSLNYSDFIVVEPYAINE